jgi:hypothetical protein
LLKFLGAVPARCYDGPIAATLPLALGRHTLRPGVGHGDMKIEVATAQALNMLVGTFACAACLLGYISVLGEAGDQTDWGRQKTRGKPSKEGGEPVALCSLLGPCLAIFRFRHLSALPPRGRFDPRRCPARSAILPREGSFHHAAQQRSQYVAQSEKPHHRH